MSGWKCPECEGEFSHRIVEEYRVFKCPWCGMKMEEANKLANKID